MRKLIATALLFTALPALSARNKPRSLHIQGAQAFRLISLLVTGSNAIQVAFMDRGGTHIALRDLEVMKLSTFKYDKSSAMYRLDVYSAHVQVGDAEESTPLGEATALYAFLLSLGVTPDGSMQGTILEAGTVDCRIDAHIAFDKPRRFVCDLAQPL
jgi:hypothetical protein